MSEIIVMVHEKMQALNLSLTAAAKEIGVTSGSLEKHLAGDYVRSDSLAKYRSWLSNGAGASPTSKQDDAGTSVPDAESEHIDPVLSESVLFDGERPNGRAYNVIDLFSGCGGMSLGFDLLADGSAFRTILAMDIEEPMVACYNHNHNLIKGEPLDVCQRVNLAEFNNEAEILGFYLDHYSRVAKDDALVKELDKLPMGGMKGFKALIRKTDTAFLTELEAIRNSESFRKHYTKGVMASLGQTAVTGFQNALGLPLLSSRTPTIGPLVWANSTVTEAAGTTAAVSKSLQNEAVKELKEKWKQELAALKEKASGGRGRGQLASSATKIGEFAEFLESPPMKLVMNVWLSWMGTRTALRRQFFEDSKLVSMLRSAYRDERRADVIIGGPPCQGFSRIGRGKIRSLQESGVHVQQDAEAGDQRNLLLYKYVMFVGALAPKAFLFENVSHFQSEVKTSEGTFLASEILAEAIRDISNEHVEYSVASKIISCASHYVPQARQRFFMSGVRDDLLDDGEDAAIPRWVISLPRRDEVPLLHALEGLPEPHYAGKSEALSVDLAREVECLSGGDSHSDTSAAVYRRWIRQSMPRRDRGNAVDSHYARRPRRDDENFFALVGPGKRWMDYRCDDSQTLKDIADVVDAFKSLLALAEKSGSGSMAKAAKSMDRTLLERVETAIDGSLSLKLLLDTIRPHDGELHHHLATPTYLEKRNGNHGDWLSRLDASRPSKTVVSHMAKDTYAYIHPFTPRTLSVREAARIQSFPDWFSFSCLGLVDAYRVVGNAVPPLLSAQLAERVAQVLWKSETGRTRTNRGKTAKKGRK